MSISAIQQSSQANKIKGGKHLLVHLPARTGRSTQDNAHLSSSSSGVQSKVKKLMIKAESLKLVTNDSKSRLPTTTQQVMNLVKHSSNAPESKRSLKISGMGGGNKPRNITISKIKS